MKLECDIQKTIDQASEFLLLNGSDHRSVLRYTLFLEEALLVYRDDAAFCDYTLECIRHKKTAAIRLTVPGKQLDPFENNMVISKALKGLENPPVYEYRSGKNIITYKPVMLIPNLKSLRFSWDHIGEKRSTFILATVLNAIETVIEIVLPVISALVIAALTTSLLERLIYMGLVLAAVRVIRDLLVYVNQNMYASVYKAMSNSLSAALTEKMLGNLLPLINVFADVSELCKIIMLSCERMYQLMVSRDFPREIFGQMHTERLRGEIGFRSVSFAYPIGTAGERGCAILDHMDFHIRAGEYVALVGRSGCGKSTVFNLITKLFEAQLGEVCLDGIDIKRAAVFVPLPLKVYVVIC